MGPANMLKDKMGFDIVELNGKVFPSISSKKILLKKEFHNAINIIKHYKEINNSHILICPNYVALFLLCLQRFHLLKVDTLCWFGAFIHSPSIIDMIGKFFKIISVRGG